MSTRSARRSSPNYRSRYPPGLEGIIAVDTTTVVSDSIKEVEKTLAEAIIIVIIVIFLFLQDWRATLIPAITIPVSLIGTFLFIKIFGFSINSLTLFGITLATGLVVDDAIVVIENVQRHLEGTVIMGNKEDCAHDPHKATSVAMAEVTSAVIATSLVLISVFVPVSFFPGNDRNPLQTVLADHRVLDCHLGVQCADAVACPGGSVPAAGDTSDGPAGSAAESG